jgi:hypothetical protein
VSRLRRPPALGIDLRPKQGESQALELENCRYDHVNQCWTNDRGWCQYYIEDGTTIPLAGGRVLTMGAFSRHQGAEEYILYEQKVSLGQSAWLRYLDPGDKTNRVRTLVANGRALTGNNHPGTSYVPMGPFCLIINGEDPPLRFEGKERVTTFGFHARPSAPVPTQGPGLSQPGLGVNAYHYAISYANASTFAIGVRVNCAFGISGDAVGATGGSAASYQYAVTFISETGSESPRSPLSNLVRHRIDSDSRIVIPVFSIPKGPEGTVKRRLYRTKNQRDGFAGEGSTLYFLDDIPNNVETIYYDAIPDTALGAQGPSLDDSAVFPTGVRYGAAFLNRMFVAGGSQHPTRIFFSAGNAPEQFPTNNYFDVGSTVGGEVTGLYQHNDLLLVFRRNAIDAIVPTDSTTTPFSLVPVTQGVGTVATKSIATVPGIGVMFLSEDGFYVIRGNLTNEQSLQVVRVSDGLGRYVKRLTRSSLAKTVAVYNAKDQEYWCHAPVDGNNYPSLGLVFHAANGQWSTRTSIPASSMAVCREGFTIFGSHAGHTGFTDAANKGIFTWCGVNQWGYVGTSAAAKPEARWGSGWSSFEVPEQLKKVQSITLELIETGGAASGGKAAGTLTYYTDWHDAISIGSESTSFGEIEGDSADRHRYDAVVLDSSAKFDNPRVIRRRFDLSMEKGCKWFRFEIAGTHRFQLIGYTLQYTYVGDRGNQTHVWRG